MVFPEGSEGTKGVSEILAGEFAVTIGRIPKHGSNGLRMVGATWSNVAIQSAPGQSVLRWL